MSVSNNIIKSPIGLQEVYSLLGVAKQGTYYDVGYICSNAHGKINQWSKHKPVKNSKVSELSESDFATPEKNYGLKIVDSSGKELTTALDTNIANIKSLNTYDYKLDSPTSVFRLTDFNEYYHNATPFVFYNGDAAESVNLFNYSNGNTWFSPDITNAYDDNEYPNYCISIEDMGGATKWTGGTPLGNFHLAAFFVRGNSYIKSVCTDNINEGGYDISIQVGTTEGTARLGMYNYVCYLGFVNESGDRILPIPKFNGRNSFNLNITSYFDGTCIIDKVGSYQNSFTSNIDLREGKGYITNWQNVSYYDMNNGQGKPLYLYNRQGICFKMRVKLNKTMSIARSDFGVKISTNSTEYALYIQLSSESKPITTGNISFNSNNEVTLYAICISNQLFPSYSSYNPQLTCRGALMNDLYEFDIRQYNS